MCGINGFTWPDESLIARMNEASRYRGPDDRGAYVDDRVSLGTVRLAIIDLSADGHQPMTNEEGTLWISYNGEIYNFKEIREDLSERGHRFKSHTDTEVVLHAYESYGLACLNRFNGMWGLALYDKRRSELILCRDRFGVKPLYYCISERGLIFSSMIGAILEHPVARRPYDRAVMEFLAYNLEQHADYTFFEGINSLLPGHLLIYNLETGDHRVEKWYTLQQQAPPDAATLRKQFVDSVKSHTVSDVPIGVCLSGGIDSTAITGALNDFLPTTFHTYSLVAPGSSVDESRYISEVVRQTRTEPYFTTIDAEVFLNDVHDFVIAMEEPVTSLSAYAQYIVFKMAHGQKAKVLLDGQGGDELLAGYVYYYGYYFYELYSGFKWVTLLKEMAATYKKFGNAFPHVLFGFLLLPEEMRYLLWKKKIVPWINVDFLEQLCGRKGDPRWNRLDVKTNLTHTFFSTSIPHNLIWEDKSSMRWSIESRVPFMDVNFVETAMAIETEQLLGNGETKRLFKEAVADLLPDMIRNRTDKIGFETPEDAFFRNDKVVAFAKDILYSESFKKRPYWNWPIIDRLFRDHLAGKVDAGRTIWKWINVELWLRAFVEDDSVARMNPNHDKPYAIPE